jgi:ribose/xylose/arabinose/galactoside ABC-type transport system permease subunit
MTDAQPAPTAVAGEEVSRAQATFDWLRRSDNVRTYVPLIIAIAAMCVYGATSSGNFLTGRNIRVLLDSVAVLGLLTVGMTLLLVTGLLDLSVGAGAALSAIIAAKIITGGGSDTLAVILMLIVPMAIGFTVGATVVLTGVQPFILTLGLLSVLQATSLIATGQRPVPVGFHLSAIESNNVIGSTVPLSFVFLVGALVTGSLILRFTRLGRDAYAIGSNERAAFLSGVPIGRVKVTLFCLSGLLVGLAGLLLLSSLGAGDPASGTGLELQAIAAAVIGGCSLAGGRGTMLGSFLGVMLLGVIQNALTLVNVSSFYQQLVLGGLLIFAVTATAIAEKRRGSPKSLQQVIRQLFGRTRRSTVDREAAAEHLAREGAGERLQTVDKR